jgi:uncharacterized protein (TIGR02594 family)
MSSINYNLKLIEEAKKWIGTKEDKSKGDNKGKEVEMFQRAVDGVAAGEPWCMAFVQFCIKKIEEQYKIQCLVFKSEHCMTVFSKSQQKIVKKPQAGDLVIWRFGNTMNGHVGIIENVLSDGRLQTIEGNTSDSQSVDRNGDGVFRKNRSATGSDSMKVVGFIRPF